MAPSGFPRRSACSSYEEYRVGQILSLDVQHDTDDVTAPVIRVRVRKIHTRTLSCTMMVDIIDQEHIPATGSTAFLKLFDRRFADSLRQQNGIEAWTKDMERAYVQFVENGTVDQFLHDLYNIENFQEDTQQDWGDGENEAFMANELLELYQTEVTIYEELRDHQGHDIPNLIAAFDLNITPPDSSLEASGPGASEHLKVKGLLLQYIDGCDLWEMPNHCPRSSWQDIVDQAVALVCVLHDHELLNKDVRPENFVVSTTVADRPKVFMIDFALCRYRRNDESDFGWGRIKNIVDEEGAVGLVMESRLLVDYGFRLRFEASGRYAAWAHRDDDFTNRAIGRELKPGVWLHAPPPWEE